MAQNVIVVGGGHNGLACAAYLAREGRKVLVIESREIVGGFCTSEETIPEAPGYKFSPTSLDLMTGNVPPSVIDELNLKRYGLNLVDVDPFYSCVLEGGSSIAFYRDYRKTCEEIKKISKEDAESYANLTEIMQDVWYVMVPYLMDHPTKPRIGTILTTVFRAIAKRKNLTRSVRMLLSAPGPLIEELFRTKELQSAFANLAAAGLGQMEDPLSGIIMATMALQHKWGVRRPVGGQSTYANAIANFVVENGGEIRCGTKVASLMTDGSRITGVVTDKGEEISASAVIGAIDPYTLYSKMAPKELVPEIVQHELENMGVYRGNSAPLRVDVALSKQLRYIVSEDRNEVLKQGTVLLAPDLDYVRRAAKNSARGLIGEELPIWLGVPSQTDRSLVPEGGDGLYVYVPTVPFKLEGSSWELEKEKVLKKVLNIIETYAPGTQENVIGTCVRSPEDLKQFSDVHHGHVFHVDMSMTQMGPWRPTPSLAGYQSPIPGLWHTGAGCHPMGTVNGWSGRTAARSFMKKN